MLAIAGRHANTIVSDADQQRVALRLGGEAVLFASPRSPQELSGLLKNFLPDLAEAAHYDDPAVGEHRTVVFGPDGEGGMRLLSALFVAPRRDEAAFAWVSERFTDGGIDRAARNRILAGRAPGGEDQGPVICSCFGVRRKAIEAAAAAGCLTVEAVGAALKAGTNCGSCRPEIKAAIASLEPAAV